MGRFDMPDPRRFSSRAAYERARKQKIAEIRRYKRKMRRIMKRVILGGMALIALLLVIGIGALVKAMFGIGSAKEVSKTILAERRESMPDLSTIKMKKEETPTLDLYVCLDPGHGDYDPGGSRPDGSSEKDDALTLALAVRDELESMGAKVLMTRDDDTFVSLSERATIANNANVDWFLSFHRNSSEDKGANAPKGVELFVSTHARTQEDGSYELGEYIMEGLEEVGISQNRGVRYGSQSSENYDYQVNRETNMPSILMEFGFMNSEEDNELFDENLEEYAKKIAKAVVKAAGLGESSDVPVKGLVLENKKIEDVDTLSNSAITWAPGAEVNDKNISPKALELQDKYSSYQTSFFVKNADHTLYLTFDTGYNADYVEEILDTLKSQQVNAVFFVNLPFVQTNEALVKRMIAEGHIIGNHSSYNKKEGIVSSTMEEQKEELNQLHEYMLEHYNYRMCLFRFPNGKFSEQSLAMVNNMDYASVFWSFSYKDYETSQQPKEKDVLKVLKNSLHEGGIYLFSARSKTNAQVLSQFIAEAEQEGYTFGTISVKSTAEENDSETDEDTGDIEE